METLERSEVGRGTLVLIMTRESIIHTPTTVVTCRTKTQTFGQQRIQKKFKPCHLVKGDDFMWRTRGCEVYIEEEEEEEEEEENKRT